MSLVALVLVGSACGGGRYRMLKKADQYALSQNWDAALESYLELLDKHPDTEGLQERIDNAQRNLAVEALGGARMALERGDWQSASAILARAEQLQVDLPEGLIVREGVVQAMTTEVNTFLEQKDYDTAYAMAATIRAKHAETPKSGDALSMVRQAVLDESMTAATRGEWSRAHALVDLVGVHEPDRAEAAERVHQELDLMRGDQLRRRSREAERAGQLGEALAIQTYVGHLTQRWVDVRERDRLRDALLTRGGFAISVAFEGPDEVVDTARSALRDAVEVPVGLVADPTLALRVNLGAALCETAETDPTTDIQTNPVRICAIEAIVVLRPADAEESRFPIRGRSIMDVRALRAQSLDDDALVTQAVEALAADLRDVLKEPLESWKESTVQAVRARPDVSGDRRLELDLMRFFLDPAANNARLATTLRERFAIEDLGWLTAVPE